MIKARFHVNGDDYRPVVWPITHPYWCTGTRAGHRSVIVAYADDEAEIIRLWPDAEDIDVFEDEAEYAFSERFQRPTWLK